MKKWLEAVKGMKGGVWLLLIAVCVLAPLIEELSMRGKGIYYFRKAFGKRAGTAVAVILTSLLFAILHGNIIQAISTTCWPT